MSNFVDIKIPPVLTVPNITASYENALESLPGDGFGFAGFSYSHLNNQTDQEKYFFKAQSYFKNPNNFNNVEMFFPDATGVKGDPLNAYIGTNPLRNEWKEVLVQPLDDDNFYRPFVLKLGISKGQLIVPALTNNNSIGKDYFDGASKRTNLRLKFTNNISQDFKGMILVIGKIKLKIKCGNNEVISTFAAFHKKDNTPHYYPTVLVGGDDIDKDNIAPLSIDNVNQYNPIGFLGDVVVTKRAKASLVRTIDNNGEKIPYTLSSNILELSQMKLPLLGYRLVIPPNVVEALKKANDSISSAKSATINNPQGLQDAINNWTVEYSDTTYSPTNQPLNPEPKKIIITKIELYQPNPNDLEVKNISIWTKDPIPVNWKIIKIKYNNSSDTQILKRTDATNSEIPKVAYKFTKITDNHYKLVDSFWPINTANGQLYSNINFTNTTNIEDADCFLENYTDSINIQYDSFDSVTEIIKKFIEARIQYLKKNLAKELDDRISVLPADSDERKNKEAFKELLDVKNCTTTVSYIGTDNFQSIAVLVDSDLVTLNNYINTDNYYYFDTQDDINEYITKLKK